MPTPNQLSAALGLLALCSTALTAQAVELRVTTTTDLISCVSGSPLIAGPDAGKAATPGDECKLEPGTYTLPSSSARVTLPNLTVSSRNGRTATIVSGGGFNVPFVILANGVSIGGDSSNEGLTITGSVSHGLVIGQGAPAGAAQEDVLVRNSAITGNPAAGILVSTPADIRNFSFLDNEIRGNGDAGLIFDSAVGAVSDLRIIDNVIESNGATPSVAPDGIVWISTGELRSVLILDNQIQRNAGNGIRVASNVTNVRNFEVNGNVIRSNGQARVPTGGAGMLFANSGSLEATILNNGNDADGVGISENACSGLFVDGAAHGLGNVLSGPFFGGRVTNAELLIERNVITQNGQSASCPGIVLANDGNLDSLRILENEISQNAADAVLIINGAALSRAEVKRNHIRNNGAASFLAFLPAGGGLAAIVRGSITDLEFADNTVEENFLHGVFLSSLTGDVSKLDFQNEFYAENGGDVSAGQGLNPAGLGISSFGKITDVNIRGSQFERNGGTGAYLDANARVLDLLELIDVDNPDELSNVLLDRSRFSFNGSSVSGEFGSGILLEGDRIRQITVSDNRAVSNQEHGILIRGGDEVSGIDVQDNEMSGNDEDFNGVGSGFQLESSFDMGDVVIEKNSINRNHKGILLHIGGQSGNRIQIANNEDVNNNRDSGVEISAVNELRSVAIEGNSMVANRVGLLLRVANQGSGIVINDNRVLGEGEIGLQLDSTGVTLSANDVRDHAVGLQVARAQGNRLEHNNITNNRTGLVAAASNEPLDARNNWWGSPFGPNHPSNPDGAGDPIRGEVQFRPFLERPVGITQDFFEVLEFNVPASATPGQAIDIEATIKNTGVQEGFQAVVFRIEDHTGALVLEKRQNVALTLQASETISLSHRFEGEGRFVIEIATEDDRRSATLVVGDHFPPPAQSIAESLDKNGNGFLDDAEILNAIEIWIRGTVVPGTGQTIEDEDMLWLVELWIGSEPVGSSATANSPLGWSRLLVAPTAEAPFPRLQFDELSDDGVYHNGRTPKTDDVLLVGDLVQIEATRWAGLRIECQAQQRRDDDLAVWLVATGSAKHENDSADVRLLLADLSAFCAESSLGQTVTRFQLQQGALRVEPILAGLRAEFEMPMVTVGSSSRNVFAIEYDSIARVAWVSVDQGSVAVYPASDRLDPFTLEAGYEVELRDDYVSPPFPVNRDPAPRITSLDAPETLSVEGSLTFSFFDFNADIAQARLEAWSEGGWATLVDRSLDVRGQTQGQVTVSLVCVASGSQRQRLTLLDGRGHRSDPMEFSFECASDQAPASVQAIAGALDEDANNRLDDAEIQRALALWIEGGVAPDVGVRIDDETIVLLLSWWIRGAPLDRAI